MAKRVCVHCGKELEEVPIQANKPYTTYRCINQKCPRMMAETSQFNWANDLGIIIKKKK